MIEDDNKKKLRKKKDGLKEEFFTRSCKLLSIRFKKIENFRDSLFSSRTITL